MQSMSNLYATSPECNSVNNSSDDKIDADNIDDKNLDNDMEHVLEKVNNLESSINSLNKSISDIEAFIKNQRSIKEQRNSSLTFNDVIFSLIFGGTIGLIIVDSYFTFMN